MTTYYKKVKRRYVPIAESEIIGAYSEGTYIVVVKPGLQSTVKLTTASNADLQAAFYEHQPEILEAIHQARFMRAGSSFDILHAIMTVIGVKGKGDVKASRKT